MKTPAPPVTVNINIDNAIISSNSTVNATNSFNRAGGSIGAPGPSLGAILGAVLDALREAGVPKAQQERIFGAVCTAIASGEKVDKG